MLLTKEVEVKPTGKMIQYYKDKGYDARHNELLKIYLNQTALQIGKSENNCLLMKS